MALNRFAIQEPANPVLIAPTPEMKNDPQGVVFISAENRWNALMPDFPLVA